MVEVPFILVKTWLELYLKSDDDKIKEHVHQQLKGNFGSVKNAKEYIESFQNDTNKKDKFNWLQLIIT